MSTSLFLDTLRQHDLDKFYPTFSTHGINHLQGLAQLSVQDYAQLGITDIGDRRKIFGLIQLLRKEPNPRLNNNTANMVTSASTMTTGLRRPQSYGARPTLVTSMGNNNNNNNNNSINKNDGNSTSPLSPVYSSRLPQLNSPVAMEISSSNLPSRISRPRRPSVIGSLSNNSPTPNKSTLPQPSSTRPIRQRTMSDAGRLDSPIRSSIAQQQRPRADLRRSLYLDQDDSIKSILSDLKDGKSDKDDDSDDEDTSRRYRTSAPLLNAYGVPTVKSRASMGALKYSSSTFTSSPSSTVTTATSILPPSDLNQKIRVCVRKRPLNRKELEKGEKDISPCIGTRTLHINEPKLRLDMSRYIEQHSFTFDDVFDLDTANINVYERTALPLVKYIFDGGKATCFAYGQTGSGKTFTMLDPKHGLYIMAAKDIFSMLRRSENQHLSAWIGLYEIYQGQLYDLLNNRKKLFAREDGKQNVIISGLKEYPIDNVDKLIQVFDYGSQVRSTGSTGANDSSSRSHAVLQVLLKPKKNKKKIHGKLSFIDLAGSERGADRGEADTKTRMEGAEINKSLLALKECIRALDQDKRHTPFRQSKLTQVLKDSFVGNSRTCMIATISPGGTNSEHTLNTLRYADRVKELKGERDRRATMERTGSSESAGLNDTINQQTTYGDEDYEDDDDYTHDDSFGDVDSQDDSDILDEDTYNFGEENIFDVDFPHEQDELIRSNAFATATQKSIPRYATMPTTTPYNHTMRRGSSTSTSRYETDESNELADRRPSLMAPKSYMSNSTNTTTNHQHQKSMPRSSSGMIINDISSNGLPYSTLTNNTINRSPSLTTDTTNNNNNNNYDATSATSSSSHQRRLPISPTSITTPTSARFSFSSTTTTTPSYLDYNDMEDFVKLHRAEIRAVTDYTKRESKLVATISLQLSSNRDINGDDDNDNDDGFSDDDGKKKQQQQQQHLTAAGQYKSNQQFKSYLHSLDSILDEKMASIAALRDRINDTMSLLDG
ncbi:P-loop containing nucleoside triphosphate hydrolase protein [Chlamydoabsidia padenii]|nr:P-loop containing nucleoside triphosphate hydrolase protein [Chlamydoabsidia padenii]